MTDGLWMYDDVDKISHPKVMCHSLGPGSSKIRSRKSLYSAAEVLPALELAWIPFSWSNIVILIILIHLSGGTFLFRHIKTLTHTTPARYLLGDTCWQNLVMKKTCNYVLIWPFYFPSYSLVNTAIHFPKSQYVIFMLLLLFLCHIWTWSNS